MAEYYSPRKRALDVIEELKRRESAGHRVSHIILEELSLRATDNGLMMSRRNRNSGRKLFSSVNTTESEV